MVYLELFLIQIFVLYIFIVRGIYVFRSILKCYIVLLIARRLRMPIKVTVYLEYVKNT